MIFGLCQNGELALTIINLLHAIAFYCKKHDDSENYLIWGTPFL